MRMHGIAGLVSFAMVGLSTSALSFAAQQQQATPNATDLINGYRHTCEVDGQDLVVREEQAFIPRALPNMGVQFAGPVWTHPDAGQNWIGRVVAIAQGGTQVFTEFDTSSDRAEFISGFDQNPVSPVWSDPAPFASQDVSVDASESNNIFVSARQIPANGLIGPRNVFVRKYSSSSGGNADWVYQFPIQTLTYAKVAVSRDGQRIVAAVMNNTLARIEIAFFSPDSSTPTAYYTRVIGPQCRTVQLSADGSTLYFASGTALYVLDIATQQLVANFPLLTSLDCQAISGDGSVFAYGYFNGYDVYERQSGGNYIRTHQRTIPGQIVCSRLAISDDSSTIVAGLNYWGTNQRVRIEAFDVASKQVTMSDEPQGSGTFQNIVSDIALSRTGGRFVVGLWGDEAGLCDELRMYRRTDNTPINTYDYPGSIFDVDMSRDGRRVAVASKAVHANLYAVGGEIDLFAVEDEDFTIQGIPQVGHTVQVQLSNGPANSPVRLLASPNMATNPRNFPGVGTLYLGDPGMTATSMGLSNGQGEVTYNLTLPGGSNNIGRTFYYQGLYTSPRQLTRNWSQVTLLP